MRTAGRLVIAVPALAILAWVSVEARRMGVTESAVYSSVKEISTWKASGATPGLRTIDWVKADLARAEAETPHDAAVQELLGILAMMQARQSNTLAEAQERFEAALHERPTSPYTWASLAETLYGQGDTGAKYELALRNAVRFGPYEPEVQGTVTDFGLATWDDSTPETRKAVEAAVANGMRRNAMETLRISERRGRLAIACRHLGESTRTDPKASQICQSTGAT